MNKLTKQLAGGALALSLLVVGTAAMAKPLAFAVGDSKNRDVVSFTSDAPIELIVGKTSKVTGNVTIDDSLDLSKQPLDAVFEVDLASIDTGIELRNEHMRDNFLETKKFPKATFKLKSLDKTAVLKPGQKTRIMAKGDFTLHGKTVSKIVPVDVTYFRKCAATETKMPGCDILQVNATFKVPFADHSIKRPEVVFQKLADTVIVSVGASAYGKPVVADAGKPAAVKATAAKK